MKQRKRRLISTLVALLGLLAPLALASAAGASGAERISGGLDLDVVCDNPDYLVGSDYQIPMGGDLVGCIYGYTDADTIKLRPSGVYTDRGLEIFVGCYEGGCGTFEMYQRFSAKFDFDAGTQAFGRCQHPILPGTGTGAFEGVTGRIDFKDIIEDGVVVDLDYRGSLKF